MIDWDMVKITIYILLYVGISGVIVWKAMGVSE